MCKHFTVDRGKRCLKTMCVGLSAPHTHMGKPKKLGYDAFEWTWGNWTRLISADSAFYHPVTSVTVTQAQGRRRNTLFQPCEECTLG